MTLAARLDKKGEQKSAAHTAARRRPQHKSPELALHLLKRTIETLRKQTRRAMPEHAGSEWSNYTATLTHYTEQESAQKMDWVRGVLEELRPARVLDIGANTGVFSALAAEQGAQVVALERRCGGGGELVSDDSQRSVGRFRTCRRFMRTWRGRHQRWDGTTP